jgi:hypothetical protein
VHSPSPVPAGSDLQLLAGKWLNGITIAHTGHARAATSFRQRGRVLGTCVTVLATLTSAGASSQLLPRVDSPLILVVSAVLGVSAAALSALQTFLEYPTLASAHRIAATDLAMLRREFEVTIAKNDAALLERELSRIRARWNRIERMAPHLPQRFHDQALMIAAPAVAKQRKTTSY